MVRSRSWLRFPEIRVCACRERRATPSPRSSLAADHAAAQRLDHRGAVFADSRHGSGTSRSRPRGATASQALAAMASAAARGSSATSATKPQRRAAIRPDAATEQRHFLQHRLGQQPRQPLRARPARHDADLRLGQGKRRLGRHHADVAGGRQFQPATEGMAVSERRWSACDSRARRSKMRCPLAHPMPRELGRRQVAPGVDICARAEGPVASAAVTSTQRDLGIALHRVADGRPALPASPA